MMGVPHSRGHRGAAFFRVGLCAIGIKRRRYDFPIGGKRATKYKLLGVAPCARTSDDARGHECVDLGVGITFGPQHFARVLAE